MRVTWSGLLLAAGLLAACAPADGPAPIVVTGTPAHLPPMRLFGAYKAPAPTRSNAEIAGDFIDLSFRLETGADLQGFARFTGPMTVRTTGPVPPTAAKDLDLLLQRLRSEAGLPIRQTADANAAITIEFLPRRQMQSRAPDAACFVAPRVSSWAEYRSASRATLDWTNFTQRDRAAIFIPDDIAPQEIRDCLNEELAQTLGPLNDLFRLPDTIFNDDNVNSLLTGFDMLVLRATYAPELVPGMTRAGVAQALPAILARLNPAGEKPAEFAPETPRAYKDAIARALGGSGGIDGRLAAAERALAISEGWQDHRTGFALLAVARLAGRDDLARASAAADQAAAIFRARDLPLYAAHADMQRALFALGRHDWTAALSLADGAIPAARAGQNAALLSGLLLVKSAVLDHQGQGEQAARARLDSLEWARYGIGAPYDINRHMAAIDALAAPTEETFQ